MSKPAQTATKTKDDTHSERNGSQDGDRAKSETPQDGTDNTSFDTDQHSDAPGPFGTS